jgi:hypothetical protein
MGELFETKSGSSNGLEYFVFFRFGRALQKRFDWLSFFLSDDKYNGKNLS